MIKRFYTTLIIYMVMLYTHPVYSINFFFSHLGVEDGLSQVSVLDIFQDSDGYIWSTKIADISNVVISRK